VEELEKKVLENKVDLEVALKRANSAEEELIDLRKGKYQLEIDYSELKRRMQECKQRLIEEKKKFETVYNEYQRVKIQADYKPSHVDKDDSILRFGTNNTDT